MRDVSSLARPTTELLDQKLEVNEKTVGLVRCIENNIIFLDCIPAQNLSGDVYLMLSSLLHAFKSKLFLVLDCASMAIDHRR